MSTKKTTRKVLRKKVAPKAHAPAVREVTAAPTQGEFTTEGPTPMARVPRGEARLYVNGRDQGNVATVGLRLGDFVRSHAREHNIRSFSVYADGKPLSAKDANSSMASYAKVDIVAKDARG